MPSIVKVSTGYRVQLYVQGIRASKVLPTKREALEWADSESRRLRNEIKGTNKTLHQALIRYGEEVSPTGMRAGEICGLEWSRVHADHVVLPMTKNCTKREVPLSPVARKILSRMRGFELISVFSVSTQTLDALFRKYRKRAGLDGFTFHDSRHTAATRLSSRLDVLTLCKVMGWSKTDQALTYYNPKASDIPKKLG